MLPQMLDRFPDVIGILRPQAAEPSLCLWCELDLPRHPGSVMSLPVTGQDAFVPSLSNQSPATLYNATNLPQRPPFGGSRRMGFAAFYRGSANPPAEIAAQLPPSAFNRPPPLGDPFPLHASQPGPAE